MATRRDILKRAIAVLTAGVAAEPAMPWVKPATLIENHVGYLTALQKAYDWRGVLAGIDFAQDPSKTYITLGRMDADGDLEIISTRR